MRFGLFDHTGGDRSRAALIAVIEDEDTGWEHDANRLARRMGLSIRWLSERVVPHVATWTGPLRAKGS